LLRSGLGGAPLTRRPGRSGGSELGGQQVEGRQAVRELLRAGKRRVHQLYLAESGERSGAVAEILDLAQAAAVPVRFVGRERIQSLAATDAPQGVVAQAGPVRAWQLEELARDSTAGPKPFLVVLDGVTDPHNLGAVMRSAVGAGATGLVIARHRSAHLTPAAVKAAAGAVEHLPVATVPGVPAALQALKDLSIWTVGLDAAAPSPIWDLAVATDPVALVLGAEGRGLAALTRRRCELLASIPLKGPLDSLNVAAAAALACFEVSRRRRPNN
jgi:23S rRNA (guanosine2251-2'-O)-methyltransferase